MSKWISAAKKHVKKNDPALLAIMEKVGKYSLTPRRGHYKSLVRAIISQQISTGAARSIRNRLIKVVDNKLSPKNVLSLTDDDLKRVGLSPQKKSYILDLSKKVHMKEVKLGRYANYTDEEIIIELTKIKGIGRWTAEMFLIFSLNRPNVLPLDDLGVKKGMMRTYNLKNLPTKTQMERIARKWEPYRTLGSWYMWRSLEV